MRFRRFRTCVLKSLIIIILIITGCDHKEYSDRDAVASWGDTTFSAGTLKQILIQRSGSETAAKKLSLETRLSILNAHLERDLMLSEARRIDIDKREGVMQTCVHGTHTLQGKIQEDANRRSVAMLYDSLVMQKLFPEKRIQKFWKNDQEEVLVRHVLIRLAPGITGRDTVKYWSRINEVYNRAKSGADFALLVDRYSEDDSIDPDKHGLLGYIYWGKMVDEFQEAAWALESGQISKPIRTRYGYHVIKMIDRKLRRQKINTSHILAKCRANAEPAETTLAWDRAVMILREAQKPGVDFEVLARDYSEDPVTWTDGIVGYVDRSAMPAEYWEKAYQMETGAVDGPVRSIIGYHIIKVNERMAVGDSLEDNTERNRVIDALTQLYRDDIQARVKTVEDSVLSLYKPRKNDANLEFLRARLNDESIDIMTFFPSLSSEELSKILVSDSLGEIRISDLAESYGNAPPIAKNPSSQKVWDDLIKPQVFNKYYIDIARNIGLHEHPEVLKEAKESAERFLLLEINHEEVVSKISFNETDLEKYYSQNVSKYSRPAKATVCEIMVDDEEFADELLARVKNGEEIPTLAKQHSMRKGAYRKNGRLGPFKIDQYGPLSRKAFEMEVGEIAGPIEVNEVYSIIRLDEIQPEVIRPFGTVRSRVEADLRAELEAQRRETWMSELKKRYKLKINKDVVENFLPIIPPLPDRMVQEREKLYKERKRIGYKSMRSH